MGQLIMLTCDVCVRARRPNIVYTHATSLNSRSPPGLSFVCIKRSKFAQEADSENKENNHQPQKAQKQKTNIKTSRRHTHKAERNQKPEHKRPAATATISENIKLQRENAEIGLAQKSRYCPQFWSFPTFLKNLVSFPILQTHKISPTQKHISWTFPQKVTFIFYPLLTPNKCKLRFCTIFQKYCSGRPKPGKMCASKFNFF